MTLLANHLVLHGKQRLTERTMFESPKISGKQRPKTVPLMHLRVLIPSPSAA